MPDLHIRTFSGTDLPPVVALWNRALTRDPINTGRFVAWLFGDPDYRPEADSGFFVAVGGGELLGFLRAIVRHWPNDRLGLEPDDGWIAVMAVDPAHQKARIGTALLDAGLAYLRNAGRRRVWVCGNTGSAPGYIFPGVDKDAYPGAMALLKKSGFVVDHEPVAMAREVVDFDVNEFRRRAWATGADVEVSALTPDRVQDFLVFMADAFPGDWNIAARAKIKGGPLDEVLIATLAGRIVGYCQWEGEHFGPFGVAAEARNRRIGAKLFTEAVRRIREADGRTVWFNWADEDAARFYRSFGLHDTRRFAIMRKDL
ncbi:MAG: GNAT family N-acetyltransferase [Phycisphaerales bacterium]|nr:MAG: GNAT family N-acetyltransferase [Phycisphaerales bacterium]